MALLALQAAEPVLAAHLVRCRDLLRRARGGVPPGGRVDPDHRNVAIDV